MMESAIWGHFIWPKDLQLNNNVLSFKGLVVPVLRNAGNMNFAEIEKEINTLAKKATDGSISIDEMAGGTFTISNGGVYGSLLSTPIINPPQVLPYMHLFNLLYSNLWHNRRHRMTLVIFQEYNSICFVFIFSSQLPL